ncbi:MAG TPA: heme o synthase [Bacteroidia bacterium]|nr:heme o synthase [Bacteroidia bacterium]
MENIHPDIKIEEVTNPVRAGYSKTQAYIKLTKFKLSFLVVLSAVISYFTLCGEINIAKIIAITIGGFLVTGAANGFNQVIEKNLDKLMTRTSARPLPQNILSSAQALIFCFIMVAAGIFVLGYWVNVLSGILGALSVVLYALVYTPLKRKTPFSVFVGAFPGAIPTLIGGVAASNGFGEFSFHAWLLFAVQFMWQFPHFWAIAWVSHDDYRKAGFFMLPSLGGRDKSSAFQIVVYTIFLIPVSILPQVFGLANYISGIFVILFGIFFLIQALTLYLKVDIQSARKLMFGSFIYLPLVQLCIMFGALWK